MGNGPFISLEMERDRETSAFGGVKGTPPRRVLIGATALEGHILEILPPLVFSTDDAKLSSCCPERRADGAVLDPPAGLPVQACGWWDKGCLIEPTGSVTASIAALSTTLPGES